MVIKEVCKILSRTTAPENNVGIVRIDEGPLKKRTRFFKEVYATRSVMDGM